MRFRDIPGNEELKSILRTNVGNGRISHAMLFSGKTGYGSLALAIAMARFVICTGEKTEDACGKCPSCRKMDELAHPDVHFVFPVKASGSASVKSVSENFMPAWREIWKETGGFFDEQQWYARIDMDNKQGTISRQEAEEVIKKLSLKPFESDYKVMVVWLPERMRPEAANALLKIIEEPWDKTVFIFVSEEPGKLLPTILSRTQSVDIGRPGAAEIRDFLTGRFGIEEQTADHVSRICEGSVTRALHLSRGGEDRGQQLELFTALMRLSYNDKHLELMDWADNASSLGREEQKSLMDYSIELIRDNYMLNRGMEQIVHLSDSEKDFCSRFNPYINNANVEDIVREMERTKSHIIQNGNPKIIFTHFALTVSKLINKLS